MAVRRGVLTREEARDHLAAQKRDFEGSGRMGRIDAHLAGEGRIAEGVRSELLRQRDEALVRSLGARPQPRLAEIRLKEHDEVQAVRQRFLKLYEREGLGPSQASERVRRPIAVQRPAGARRPILTLAAAALLLVATSIGGFLATRTESPVARAPVAPVEPCVRAGQSVRCYAMVPPGAPIESGGRPGTLLRTPEGLTVWAVDESGRHRELFESLAEGRKQGGRIVLKVQGRLQAVPPGSRLPEGADEAVFLNIDTASRIRYEEYAGVADHVQVLEEEERR